MKDITGVMNGYRECVRHLWNTYFWQGAEPTQDWDLRDRFDEVSVSLFKCLVLRTLNRDDVELIPSYRLEYTALSFIRLEVAPESPIMINRRDSATYWDDPLRRVQTGELDLRFIQFFDWELLGFREFAFYRVEIVGSQKHPNLVGRHALLPVSPNVAVIYDDAA